MNKEINRNKKVGAHHIYTSLRFKSAEAEKRLMPQCFAADSSAAKHKHQFFAVMRMTGYLFFIISLFSLLLLQSSCINDMPKSGDDTAHLSLTLDASRAASDLSDAEGAVNDITVLVFDSSNNLIGRNYSTFTDNSYTMNVTARTGTNCTICAIANTGSSTYFSDVSTLDQLNSKYTLLNSGLTLGNGTPVMMFGKKTGVTLSQNTTLTDFSLARLCSKFNIIITPASGVTITGYQLCHVPSNSYIFDGKATSNPSKSYPDLTAVTGLVSTSALPVTYYLYENFAGTNAASTSEALRTSANAPVNASYLLVNAKTSSWHSTCRIYLGGTNPTDYTNYTIPRNYNYTYNIAINTSGQSDARVSYAGDSYNCYMVSPGASVSIPINRVNDFWGSSSYGNNTTYVIGTNDNWQAKIIWQDVTGLVTMTKSTGTGPNEVITLQAPSSTAVGNALIGIQKTSGTGTGTNLWSWHLWVTGYDPNSSTVTYNNKKWMTYNLGATTSNSYGLYYEWGRKDPFKKDNSGSVSKDPGSGNNLALSVQYPTNYYIAGSTTYDWYTNVAANQNNNLWGSSKTIYDPCPAGWKVPTRTDWNAASFNNAFSLPVACYLDFQNGEFYNAYVHQYYWAATNNSGQAYLFADNTEASSYRVGGVPIRCVQGN